MTTITPCEIKNLLKQFSGGLFGHKPHKTIALLDPIFCLMTIAALRSYVDKAHSKILSRISYAKNKADCENITNWCLSELQMQWAQDNMSEFEPAIFRIVIDGDPRHAIAIAFLQEGIYFIEFQTGEIWSIDEYRPKVLALT